MSYYEINDLNLNTYAYEITRNHGLDRKKNYPCKIKNNKLYLEVDDNNLILIDGKSPEYDFLIHQAPWFKIHDLKINLTRYNISCSFKLEILNYQNILKLMNHDYVLRKYIFSLFDYTRVCYSHKFSVINTPIYKSKINIKPSEDVDLFDYQINNIEIMKKLVKKGFEINLVSNPLTLDSTDEEPEKTIYFDNFNLVFTKQTNYAKIKTQGGILADEMGLGKTITMISYLKTLPSSPVIISKEKIQAKANLVIVPSHLAKQWTNEIKKVWSDAHVKLILTKRDHLSIKFNEILDYDFVIVSQQFLVNKSHYLNYPLSKCTPSMFNIFNKVYHSKLVRNGDKTFNLTELSKLSPIFEVIEWNNLVLDEGHEIMNGTFGNSGSISRCMQDIIREINGKSKWFISGTPFTNNGGLDEIYKFLKIKINNEDFNKSLCKNIVYSKDFLNKIMIRHSKKQVEEQLNLQGLEEKVYWLEQTQTEKQIYQGSINRGRNYLLRLCCHLMVADFNSSIKIQTIDIDEVKKNIISQSESKINIYTQRLNSLNPLNQSYHMLKANYTQIISQAKFMLESIKKLEIKDKDKDDEELDESDDENECPICIDEIEEPTILPCGHIFCYECITEMTKSKNQCPLCKQPIKEKLIKVSDKKEVKEEKKDDLVDKYGVKTGTLIRMVRKITSNPENNVIIFSQYDFMLKLISDSLSKNGVNNSFVKGNVFQRNKAIDSFRGIRMGESSQVIMLSLKNAASGTHLVEANHIIFVDPVDSYREEVLAIENQAIARAFRIGQKKKVNIHRLLIKNTIEEEIYNKVYL